MPTNPRECVALIFIIRSQHFHSASRRQGTACCAQLCCCPCRQLCARTKGCCYAVSAALQAKDAAVTLGFHTTPYPSGT